MPRLDLVSYNPYPLLPVEEPAGRLLIPRVQFRCWLRLPGTLLPRDGIIDTGSPFSWFPEEVWGPLRAGTDYEWLPFPAGYAPPRGQSAGWTFAFRFARLLHPIGLHDGRAELARDRAVVQFATGNPPAPRGSQKPAVVVIGLWGGILEGTALRIAADPRTGHLTGALEW